MRRGGFSLSWEDAVPKPACVDPPATWIDAPDIATTISDLMAAMIDDGEVVGSDDLRAAMTDNMKEGIPTHKEKKTAEPTAQASTRNSSPIPNPSPAHDS